MNRQSKGRRAPRGMTLIEIMVVLVILGLIASAVVIAVFPQLQRARVDRTKLDIGNIESALKLYNARKGKFPDTGTGLKALVDMEILDKMPKDAWGNDYVYTLEAGRPIVISYGADGTAGGDGSNADITNRPETAATGKP
jgi:general secretion pathway protein G